MRQNPELESSVAAFRAEDERADTEQAAMTAEMQERAKLAGSLFQRTPHLGAGELEPDYFAGYNDRTAVELVQEASIRVLQRAVLRQRMEHRTLRTLADRVQEECRRLIGERDILEATNAELRRELLRVGDDASRLRAAAEHAQEALKWGMGNE